MRIKVVTSINVRSSPFTSPRVATPEAFSDSERGDAILEKTSPVLPSIASGQLPRMDRLIASQRIPRGSRLSGWLHGSSVRSKNSKRPPVHTRKPKTSHTSTYCFAAAEGGHQHQAPGIRSYPSTRGLIDPVHSPTYGPRQLTHASDPRHDAYLERLRAELGSAPREHGSKKRHRQRSTRSPVKKQRLCFPHIKDLKMRQKIIGSLFFGTLLIILLTTYLALAISESLRGATFHGIFIFFLLTLTILFCHYLIRLCMLAFEPRTRFARKFHSPLRADAEAGFAQPRRPIPVVLAGDDEFGPHDRTPRRAGSAEDEDDVDRALPPPPPAYGLWRNSVRADPNLIHWQAVGHDNNVQQEAREMIFAGTGHRPPSYTSNERAEGVFDDRVDGVLQPQPAAAPLPSVAERRVAGTVSSRGGTVRMARSR